MSAVLVFTGKDKIYNVKLQGTDALLSKRLEPTEADRRTWLHVPSWTH